LLLEIEVSHAHIAPHDAAFTDDGRPLMTPPDLIFRPGLCFAVVDVALPLPLNHAWVAAACRSARVQKPRWWPDRQVWTSSTVGDSGALETIILSKGPSERSVRVQVEWVTEADAPVTQTHTARRVVSAMVTAMQWRIARTRGPTHAL
jgi:hypothetical protein